MNKSFIPAKSTTIAIANIIYTIWNSSFVQKTGFLKDRSFYYIVKIPCFFKTSVFLKIPRSKDRPFYQRTEFSLKFRVFSKLPCFLKIPRPKKYILFEKKKAFTFEKVDFFNKIRFVNINIWISPILYPT